MSDLLDSQHQENVEIDGLHRIGSMERPFLGGVENCTHVVQQVAQQEPGYISAPFGDAVNPNAPRVLSQTGKSGKAFIFPAEVTGRGIAKAGTHKASTWAGVQTTLAA